MNLKNPYFVISVLVAAFLVLASYAPSPMVFVNSHGITFETHSVIDAQLNSPITE